MIRVGRDGADLGNCLGVGARLGQLFQLCNDGDGRLVDAALEVHRVHAGSDGFQAFVDDGLSQYGSGSGTVTCIIVGTGGNVFDQLRAHVFKTVFKLDFLGNRHTVFGDQRSAKAFFDDNVTAFWAQGRFYCVSQDVYTGEHFFTASIAELNFFSSHDHYSLNTW
ncbi:ATP-dependent exoDNAse beta subunit [Pseudomonas syringae pv. actinidiae]|uniref:ATP-dependent exoDNAse beta subunit n=1 Tax=Pseudomonas syringae pv. actinidiae TaxID=103796 RepID=A0A2V0QPU4_PSESF|nr:ATP-dependent exoDNAse beta subunit [Pseudomonas syringae pv. actinidiae]